MKFDIITQNSNIMNHFKDGYIFFWLLIGTGTGGVAPRLTALGRWDKE